MKLEKHVHFLTGEWFRSGHEMDHVLTIESMAAERVLEEFLAWAPKAVTAATPQAAFLLPGAVS